MEEVGREEGEEERDGKRRKNRSGQKRKRGPGQQILDNQQVNAAHKVSVF